MFYFHLFVLAANLVQISWMFDTLSYQKAVKCKVLEWVTSPGDSDILPPPPPVWPYSLPFASETCWKNHKRAQEGVRATWPLTTYTPISYSTPQIWVIQISNHWIITDRLETSKCVIYTSWTTSTAVVMGMGTVVVFFSLTIWKGWQRDLDVMYQGNIKALIVSSAVAM